MDAKERREREWLVAEALTWLGTPYHHAGRVKGGGTDCGMLILQAFIRWTGTCIAAQNAISDG